MKKKLVLSGIGFVVICVVSGFSFGEVFAICSFCTLVAMGGISFAQQLSDANI